MNGHNSARAQQHHDRSPARIAQPIEHLLLSWRRPRRVSLTIPPAVDIAEAEEFVQGFHTENPGASDLRERLAQVRTSVSRTGTYEHTFPELQWATRAAWRHAARCSGRDKWRTLRVRDRRAVSDPQQVAAETVAHLREATGGGRIRSTITVFAPDTPQRRGPRILNSQAIRYAGYRDPAGGITGDPVNVPLTELAAGLGWKGDGSAFDVLPLVVMDSEAQLRVFIVPGDAVLEVPITHPQFGWFAELGLRWYAVPVITDMYLEAGGIRYPCAPFNGWYQASTEVGVRNLGDRDRYNMLPKVAAGMGLNVSSVATFWPDRAALELAVAVQHSFRAAGVMVTDHQSEARRFMRFAEAEEASGRPWCADWSWINPPISASTTPAFHRTYPDQVLKPGFFHHEDSMALMNGASGAVEVGAPAT
ncbi:MAG: nitric oxide synthase oxygenase [Actinomycetota bacterium]|nr:nitric oxide synthase oxygenase [Actinomycetota bacterium]